MLQSSISRGKPINCHRHKTEPATHICTDPKCPNPSILCSLCFRDQVNRHYHFDHEKNILPYDDAVASMCEQIRNDSVPVMKIYKGTLGRTEYGQVLGAVEKGQMLYDELEDKIVAIKGQIQLELELLSKEFQRLIVTEKQEYFKLLDNYKKSYAKNVEFIKSQAQNILDFNNSVKYYGNINNFYMKLNFQARKKSDWVSKAKKIIFNVQKNIENSNFPVQLNNTLNAFHRQKLQTIPFWKGDENVNEKGNQIKFFIKKALGQWVYIPEIKSIEQELQAGNHIVQGIGGKGYYF